MSILKRQVSSSWNFASSFIAMTHKFSGSFKLIHFLLWIKGDQSPNFETFDYTGKNLPNYSCHFPNHKSVFLQILHRFSVSWNITSLYFFSSNVIYLAQKKPIKIEILKISGAQAKIHQIQNSSFVEQKINFSSDFASLFDVVRHNSSILS